MPELKTVTITGLHADAYKPVYKGYGVWDIIAPDNIGAASTGGTTAKSMKFNIDIPTGYDLMVAGVEDLVGGVYAHVIPGIYKGSANYEIFLNIFNSIIAGVTPTSNQVIARMALVRGEYKITVSLPV